MAHAFLYIENTFVQIRLRSEGAPKKKGWTYLAKLTNSPFECCTPLVKLPTVIHEFFRHYKIGSDHNEKKVMAFSERLYCSKNFICSYLKYFLKFLDEK